MGIPQLVLAGLHAAAAAAETAATSAAQTAATTLTTGATAAGSAASGAAGLAKTAAGAALKAGESGAAALKTGVQTAAQSGAVKAAGKYASNPLVSGAISSAATLAASQALAGSPGTPQIPQPGVGVDQAQLAAQAAERARRNRAPGRAATLLTSPLGVPGRANVGIRRLTGYDVNASGRGAALLSGAIGRTSLGGE